MKNNPLRDSVQEYMDKHPKATVREIQKALNMSSPAHAYFYVSKIRNRGDAEVRAITLCYEVLSETLSE